MQGRIPTIIQAIEASPLNRGLIGADWLASEGNIAFVWGDDVTLFDYHLPELREIHILYSSTGRAAIDAAKLAIGWLFEAHPDVELIIGNVPLICPHVALIARWVGMSFVGWRNTPHGICEVFGLHRTNWKGQSA